MFEVEDKLFRQILHPLCMIPKNVAPQDDMPHQPSRRGVPGAPHAGEFMELADVVEQGARDEKIAGDIIFFHQIQASFWTERVCSNKPPR